MPLFRKSKATTNWLIRQDDPNFFKIIDRSNDSIVYKVTTKAAATRSYYYLQEGDKIIAEVEQDQIENNYHFKLKGKIVATLRISDKEVVLTYVNNEYRSKPEIRAKGFDFTNVKGDLVFTIDKLKISINDKYAIEVMKSFNHDISIMVAICIDDAYHKGLTT